MRYAKALTRATLALAIIAFVPWPHMNASIAAREFALCMHACNAFYQTCWMGCDDACGEEAQPDCKMLCRQACLDHVRNCKVTCRPEPESGQTTRRIVQRS
ncbi:MAG: hypothetical protein ACREAA_07165 [Candidatus Polarisedimenticolia bacterium]